MMFTRSTLVAAGFFLTANAHLFISSPSPIEGTAIKDPLTPSGANFPCHGVPLPGSGGQSMAVGSSQNLIFDVGTIVGKSKSGIYVGGGNTAVHGGGSCQLSITYETDAEKIKQANAWKVIYSMEEGCPTNSPANLEGTYTGPLGTYNGSIHCNDPHANGFDCVNSFDFTIPKGVKNGQATLAWTWFNNVGNREMYMNCVAIDITGGSDNSDMTDFPDIFLANIGAVSEGKQTDESPVANAKFPSPGKYVTTKTATTTYTSGGAVVTIASGTSFPLAIPSSFAGSGSSSESAASSYSATPTSYSTSASSAAVPASYAAVPTSESSAAVAATTMATLTGTASTPSASSYSSSSTSSSNSTSGTCSDGRVSCSSPGGVICIGSTQFGICNTDHCAVPQDMAAGTSCSSGVITKRAVVDVVRRRSSRLQRHVAGSVHKKQF